MTGGIKPWAATVISIVSAFGTLMVMALIVQDKTPDWVLMALGVAPCLAAVGWGLKGAPQFPRQAAQFTMMPAIMVGVVVMTNAADRYPPLSPFLTGAALTLVFVVLGCAVSWPAIQNASGVEGGHSEPAPAAKAEAGPGPMERLLALAVVYAGVGILFFQPLVLLANGTFSGHRARLLPGTVTRLYRTQGKGAAPYVVLSGPAAGFSNTGPAGEFKVTWKAYEQYHIGDSLCLNLHTGPARIDWWAIDDCGRTTQFDGIKRLWQAGDHGGAIAALEALAARDQQVFNSADPLWLSGMLDGLNSAGQSSLSLRLLALLASPAYQPADPGLSSDGYRYAYAIKQSEAGNRTGAAASLAAIDSARQLMMASLHPALRDLMPADFDAHAAVERQIDDLHRLIEAHPDRLGPKLRLASAYEALKDGGAMLAVLEPAKPQGEATGDQAQQRENSAWWLLMARAYAFAGRYQEALGIVRASMAPGAANADNQAQLLLIAGIQLYFSHGDAALATLAQLNPRPAGWGSAQEASLREMRGCANAQQGHWADVEADRQYVLDHDADRGGTFAGALLCMHDDDDAAAQIIRDLANPRKRAFWLLTLSDFAPNPATTPEDAYAAGYRRVKQRADVRAAIARAGGTREFNIPAF